MWLSRMPGDEFWYFLWRNYNEKYLLMTLMIIIMIMKQNIQLMILLDPSLCWTIFIFSNSIIHTWYFAQIKFFNVIFTLRTNEEKFSEEALDLTLKLVQCQLWHKCSWTLWLEKLQPSIPSVCGTLQIYIYKNIHAFT